MPETRKFAQGLKRKGISSTKRESLQPIRNSVYSEFDAGKSGLTDPILYEDYILKRQSEINHDSLQDLLVFPKEDIVVNQISRELRTVVDTVPPDSLNEASSLMVQECIKNYSSNWHVIEKKFEAYSDDYLSLPKNDVNPIKCLSTHVFEVDNQNNVVEEDYSVTLKEGLTKRGWLYKAPDYGIANISAKSFKRRFCHLLQLPDSSYILNYYKDDKISKDPKGAIYLDSCVGAYIVSKGKKHSFELRMQDQNSHLFAGETEADASDWVTTINQALQNTVEAQKEKHEHEAKLASRVGDGDLSNIKSMHSELVKYAKETEQKNTQERKKNRQKILNICPDFQNRFFKESRKKLESWNSSDCVVSKTAEKARKKKRVPPPPLVSKSKQRVLVDCKSISFSLRGVVIDGANEPLTNVEPFFVSLSLYDVSAGKKISGDLHVDLNHALVLNMIPNRSPVRGKRPSVTSEESHHAEPNLPMFDSKWLAHPKKGIFTVSRPHTDIYLVVRIEKVLQGSIKSCAPPYMRSDSDNHKTAIKVLKHARVACQRLGQYRMPFAWTAKQLFADDKGRLNTKGFDLIYKQEASKVAEEDLLKFLSDFKRQEKLSKLEFIDCDLLVDVSPVPSDLPNILTSSLVPVKPFLPNTPHSQPVFEVDEFFGNSPEQHEVNTEYLNHCYIYPKSLNYDNQKSFAKARNIAVVVEFRDAESSTPLWTFYKRPSPPGDGVYYPFPSAAVLHHHEKPEFYEEWKLLLPTQLHHGHHLVFTFYHVVVDTSSKKKDQADTEVGQAFLPLLMKDGRLSTGEHVLPVATTLHPGYLTSAEHIGRHGQEIKWVDGGKNLFRVGVSLVSSVYTDDQHIHNFFEACNRFHSGASVDTDITKYLKSLLACELSPLIRFLPILLKQLFFLFTADRFGSDIETLCMKTLVNIVATCHANDHDLILQQYINYMFVTAPWKDHSCKTIHEELATAMTNLLRPTATDFLTSNKLLLHLSFFLQIIIKSMIQHLTSADKMKLSRSERFPISFQHSIHSLLNTAVPHITKKWKTNYSEVHSANLGLARFVRDCFSHVDRGFVFKLINNYCRHFNPGDPKVLFELKFEFLREVCNHEHYIPLNLPFACSTKPGKNSYSYCLTDDYCSIHFLSGLLMKSLCDAMYEPPEIRSIAIEMFRNLLAKHSFDDRYPDVARQSRIASLYLPFLRIVLDNVTRFPNDPDSSRDFYPTETENGDAVSLQSRQNEVPSSPGHLPPVGDRSGSLRMRVTDSSLMSTIANPGSTLLVRSSLPSLDNSSMASSPAKPLDKSVDALKECASIASTTRFFDSENLDATETRSLLLCFLYVVDNLPNPALLGFLKDSTSEEQVDFFQILILCLRHFRYSGKKHQFNGIKFGSLSKLGGSVSRSFPVRIRSSVSHLYKNVSILSEPMVRQASHMVDEEELEEMSLLESNLSNETGKIVLDICAEFIRHHKKQLQNRDGDNPLMRKLFDVLLSFLQISQSEEVLRHVFATFRLVLHKFPYVFFRGSADLCASLIYYALKCCNSSLASTRSEACALLYLLMRSNYETTKSRSFVRSQLQMIKAVSQLISEEVGIGSSLFQHSLSIINTFAVSDKGMQSTPFPNEVKDLTKKIRTVLSATAAMKEHRNDPEMLIDLQCSLAKSYSSTPELRKTWLESMARTHTNKKNFSEAAMCYVHIAALVAEYLKRKAASLSPDSDLYAGLSPDFVSKMFGNSACKAAPFSGCDANRGCSSFRGISQNVEKEESSIKEDAGMQDVQYTEGLLVGLLETCADSLLTAERYELLAPIYNMIIPYYEKKRDYQSLIAIYSTLKNGYEKVVEVNRNGKRLLGTYFRVAFFGLNFDEEDGKQYIYKEPKLTQLSEISQRLIGMSEKKFGKENVRLIQESGKVNRKDLDPKLTYIQVTYVLPYFDTHEREQRRNYFEQHHNVRNFVFETPFTPGGKARGDIEEQWKRKTILTTSHCFPYITKRIPVTSTRSLEMKPIEVALDEMMSKCNELEQLVVAEHIDLKKLQLRLQGSVNVQVNAGPLAYARAFLCDDNIGKHAANTVEMLRQIYRRFVELCSRALSINEQLITSNQHAYHQSLEQCYHAMVEELSQILHEPLLHDDDDNISVTTFGPEPDSLSKRTVAGSVSDSSNV